MYLLVVGQACLISLVLAGETWYQGCYEKDEISTEDTHTANRLSVIECSRYCKSLSFVFAVLQRQSDCACRNDTESWTLVNADLCYERCSRSTDLLPCGGARRYYSLYLSGGPYVSRCSAGVDAVWVVTGRPVVLSARLNLASSLNVTHDLADVAWMKLYTFVWKVGNQTFTNVTSAEGNICSRFSYTFEKPGDYDIDVTCKNALSTLSTHLTVSVILPAPRHLQIIILNDKESLPSCIPVPYSNWQDGAVISVFVNTSVSLEVSVAVGTNLTFVLRYRGSATNAFEYRSSDGSLHCAGSDCRGVIQDYVFSTVGVHTVTATVFNSYGSVEKNLTVVAMEKKLGDVSFSLATDYSRAAVKVNEPIRFVVNVETTFRQNTQLIVDFGEGDPRQVSLQEARNRTENGTTQYVQDVLEGELEGLALVASYGEGCNLSVEFHYEYQQQGSFTPDILIVNNYSFVPRYFREPIIVQNELTVPKLQMDEVVLVNASTELQLSFLTSSVNMSLIWTIFDQDNNLLDNITTNASHLTYIFQESGRYMVSVTATNLINSVSTVGSIIAQHSIDNLSAFCSPHQYILLGQKVSCMAEVTKGDDVIFEWNFKDNGRIAKVITNHSSVADHVYLHPGRYSVGVMAFNSVSRRLMTLHPVTVEEALSEVDFFTSGPSLVGDPVYLIAKLDCGCTFIEFEFDLGDGRRSYKDVKRTDGNLYYLSHAFQQAGVYNVTVYASNHVSEVNETIQVLIQSGLEDVQFDILNKPIVQGLTTLLVAQSAGEILTQGDLLFEWSFPDNSSVLTRSPVIEKIFNEPGNHSVQLRVRNEVSSAARQQEVKVETGPPAGIRLLHPAAVKTFETIPFTLTGADVVEHIAINISDGRFEEYFNTSSWSHVFSLPCVYTLGVAIFGEHATESHALQSYVTAVEPITSLHLEGPSAVEIQRHFNSHLWTAVAEGGSHLVYYWSFNNGTTKNTTLAQHSFHTFDEPGILEITVRAENDISSAEASMRAVIQYPITDVKLDVPVTIHGSLTNITLMVHGGREFVVSCHFGDGNTTLLSSEAPDAAITTVKEGAGHNNYPVYRVSLAHVYSSIGEYGVRVNVSNTVSSVQRAATALVGEPITDVHLSTASPAVVPLMTPVVLTAGVSSGQHVVFRWHLSGDGSASTQKPQVTSDNNSSVVRYLFNVPSEYEVSVHLSNPVYLEPLVKTLPFKFLAVEEIKNVMFSHPTSGAPLLGAPPRQATNEVVFVAKVIEGSHASFLFDFGDGSTQMVNGSLDMFHHIVGQGRHVYNHIGVYDVQVTAVNPLGNLTVALATPFYVQVPPIGNNELLDAREYCIKTGDVQAFRARVTQGTNVSYRWLLGDETELIHTGASIQHQYRTAAERRIKVIASNQVGEVSDSATVQVVDEIQGVNLTVPKLTLATGENAMYMATPFPDIPGIVKYYTWYFGANPYQKKNSNPYQNENSISYRFTKSGRYTVSVSAHNCHGRAVSDPADLWVVSRIRTLSVASAGDSLVGRRVNFTATTWEGDYLRYTWHFGDGTPTYTVPNNTVWHVFQEVGVYVVNVTATNPVSSESVSLKLFVLHKVCRPPRISIVQPQGKGSPSFNFLQSEMVHIESRVVVNCTVTSQVIYIWTFQSVDTGRVVVPAISDTETLYHQVLILPAVALPLGKYKAKLMVQMENTSPLVYSEEEADLRIFSSPLRSIIKGGVLRRVSRNGVMLLDGSESSDPDQPGTAHIKFQWNCTTLKSPNDTCFNHSVAGDMTTNTSTLVFPALWLRSDEQEFLFNLTVSTPDGKQSATDQVVHVVPDHNVISLSIHCHQCEGRWVNANRQVSLQTRCVGCPAGSTRYKWQINLVADERSDWTYDNEMTFDMCVTRNEQLIALASSGVNIKAPLTRGTEKPTTKTTTQATVKPTTTDSAPLLLPELENFGEGTVISEGSLSAAEFHTVQERGDSENSIVEAVNPDHDIISMLGEGKPGDVGSSRGRKLSGRLDPPRRGSNVFGGRDNALSSDQFLGFGDIPQPNEGSPGASGSSHGRKLGPGGSIDNPQEVPGSGRKVDLNHSPHHSEEESDGPDPDDYHIKKLLRPSVQHLVSKDRYPISLRPNQTRTGLDKQSLVIKPNVLVQGRTYIIEVQVESTGPNPVQGLAMTYFKVNESPRKGACDIRPQFGIEMETTFTVFCRAWQDEHVPLMFEVSYIVDEEHRNNLVYRGLSQEIQFQLPAGNASNDHRVLVSISIVDNLGARTSVCLIPLIVRPKLLDTTRSAEVQLHNETTVFANSSGLLAQAVHHGDDQTSCVLISYLAARLNRFPRQPASSSDWKLRLDIRQILLELLSLLPRRDEAEVIQTAQSLVSTTAVAQELSGPALGIALDILESMQTRAMDLYVKQGNPNEDLLSLAIKAISSIMEAATGQVGSRRSLPKTLTSHVITVLDSLLKLQLKFHSVGENPIHRASQFVSVLASHYTAHSLHPITLDGATFTLPPNIMAVTRVTGDTANSLESAENECFQAHMTSFKRNPFSRKTQIQSEVVALTLYTCDGQDVVVADLRQDDMIHIEIPVAERKEDEFVNTTLHKRMMNTHQFNLTSESIRQSLHLAMELDPVQAGRMFPICLLISLNSLPTPHNYNLKYHFEPGSDQLKLFMPAGTFNLTGMYYMGIVDCTYNAGRLRKGQITARNYTLKLWFGDCMFWDERLRIWSSAGCHTTDHSTTSTIHCRCSHLSAFGGQFKRIINDLTFTDVDVFFALNQNPVTIILVGSVFVVYFFLLYLCRQADEHDAKKGGVLHLADNHGNDRQKYEVIVETGLRHGAGTTAKISIILHGEEGMSETRELVSDDDRPLFERNSRDKFIITVPDSLGKIWKVQLWHNNAGPSPSWFLSHVLVCDLATAQVFYFVCEKWFAVEEQDGRVEREVMALEGNLGFAQVFWVKGIQYMADYHLWMSVLACPSYSRFTRAQRLTCILTLLMSYMCLNAMWYQANETEYRGEFGLLDLSWQNIGVGGICCAVIVPLNLFLVVLFRRSKIRYPASPPDKVYPSGKEANSEHSSDVHDESVQPIMTYSLLDQSMVNWQNIQEWAQKQWVKRQHSVRSSNSSIKTSPASPDSPPTTHTPPANPVVHNLKKEEETDVASSGFEDSQSQAASQAAAERSRVHPTPGPTPTPRQLTPATASPCSIRQQQQQKPVYELRDRGRGRVLLPFWCRYIAWFLCVTTTVGCAGLTIFYGFRFGRAKSLMWLKSLYFSFMICLFIAHPLMILLTITYTAIRFRNDPSILDDHEDGFYGRKAEPKWKKKKDTECCEECTDLERGVAARQRSRYLRFARPPQEKQLIEARKKTLKEKAAFSLFWDSVSVGVGLLLLCFMGYGKDTVAPFYLNEALQNTFVRSGSLPFEALVTAEDWYEWSGTSLLDGIYGRQFDRHTHPAHTQVSIDQGRNHLIGHVHIRQLRVQETSCSYPPIIYKYTLPTKTCRYDYSAGQRSNKPFGVNSSWEHGPVGGCVMWGRHGVYDSSGYTLQLNNSRSLAWAQLKELQTRRWIDLQTRAIIVEFTVLNAPTNLFSAVNLLLELPATGRVFPSAHISSTRIFAYISAWDNVVLGCELMFVILTLLKLTKELCEIIELKKRYLRNYWKYIELVMCAFSLVFIACYVYRFVLVADIVEKLRDTFYEEFINISFLTLWDEILRGSVGVLLFMAMVSSLRLLRLVKLFAKFGKVYKRSRRELLLFSGLFCVILFASSAFGFTMYGAVCSSFRSLWVSLFSMTALMTRSYSYSDLSDQQLIWPQLFLLSYTVFGVGLLTCYMVAVLTRRMRTHKQGEILVMPGTQMIRFLWKEFLHWSGIKQQEFPQEPENILPAEFTMAEIEYQVDELLFRMNALSGTSGLPEKPHGYLTDSDTTHGDHGGDDGISSGGSEDNGALVDPDRLEQRVHKIEDKLCANEPYLAQLLKLDSIGADVLAQEKEKQLRSHLELELFRQLQMHRQETSSQTKPGQGSALKMAVSSTECSPSSGSSGSRHNRHLDVTLPSGSDPSSSPKRKSSQDDQFFPSLTLEQQLVMANTEFVFPDIGLDSVKTDKKKTAQQEGRTGGGERSYPALPPKPTGHNVKLFGRTSNSAHAKPSSSSENASGQSSENEKMQAKTDSSSSSDPKCGAKAYNKGQVAPKSSKPVPSGGLRELAALDVARALSGASVRLKPFKLAADRGLYKSEVGGTSITAESSSGSEQDGMVAVHGGRRPPGKRNLRKTRSRGKGKGPGGLSPALMLEDLPLEDPCDTDSELLAESTIEEVSTPDQEV